MGCLRSSSERIHTNSCPTDIQIFLSQPDTSTLEAILCRPSCFVTLAAVWPALPVCPFKADQSSARQPDNVLSTCAARALWAPLAGRPSSVSDRQTDRRTDGRSVRRMNAPSEAESGRKRSIISRAASTNWISSGQKFGPEARESRPMLKSRANRRRLASSGFQFSAPTEAHRPPRIYLRQVGLFQFSIFSSH